MQTTLQIVVALRHGDYNERSREEGELTEFGKEQMGAVASRLRSILPPGLTIAVVTSPLIRAEQSGDIISAEFGVKTVRCGILRDGSHQMAVTTPRSIAYEVG